MNLHTTIDLDLTGFLRWWGKELAFLLPTPVLSWLREDHGRFVFRPSASGFQVEFTSQSQANPGFATVSDAESFIQFRQQCPDADKAAIVLRLPADQTLSRLLHLPVAAAENVQQVVAFELDRYTPFSTDQVYFAAIAQGKTEFEHIRVWLVLTPKTYLDQQLALLQSWSVRPCRVECDSVPGHGSEAGACDLLPSHHRQAGRWWTRSAHAALWIVIALLGLANLLVPVWMDAQAVDRISAEIKALDKQAKAVETQQQEIDALVDETRKLIAIKQQSPSLLRVLDELSRLLNDDTWLTNFQYSDKHLQIQGQSPSASALIGILEASEFFTHVSFVSPLTQDKATGRERFQISMDVNAVVPASASVTDDESPVDDAAGPDPEDSTDAGTGSQGSDDAVITLEAEDAPP
ncbi:MAG: PilN domain-containing protein [Methylomonas sp.]|nr:PilN domain-containing protein [Methylomonas sp.]PPD22643.1 MAG: fimbrial assembly protein [Methylomonas sp.]PPD27955.1 MAG: fimbrial assembly protein [Methylomonas sp.]PPD40064.1 MAG: fimbrial assembly protein [Methylomonas sp.]PPD41548.1 MAG: fimbrial assembly protein [Methylomonas sp.]